MKKRDFQKGAISVFLVLILIPSIVITGTFVDLCRVKQAKAVATSAADLALNSLMANFDHDLNDYYGLMGSCQSVEQFYEEASAHFLEALYSQGLNADEAESLLAYINTLLMDGTVHDLLQMEVQTETSSIISNFDNSSLGTSDVVVKDQVVEFMKYRGPVEITTKIVDRLKGNGAGAVFADAGKDEKLVEDKQEYANAEADFMGAAYKTYKALKAYESLGLDNADLQNMLKDMKEAREVYREITPLLISNGADNLSSFKRPTYSLNKYKFEKTDSEIYSRKVKDGAGNDVYYIDGTKINSLLDDLDAKIKTFKEKRDAVPAAAGSTLVNASVGTEANQYHPIEWSAAVQDRIKTPMKDYQTAAEKMLEAYAKVLAIKKCTLGTEIPTDWETRYDRLTQSVTDLQKDFLTSNVAEKNNNQYLRLVNKLEKYSPDKMKLKNGKTVSEAIADVHSKLSGYHSTLNSAIEKLNTLIDGTMTNNPYSLDELAKMSSEYKSSYNTWKGTATNSTTGMGEADREDIAKMESNGQVLAVGKQDILDFKSRLVSVRERLAEAKSTLESMKFGSKKVMDISNFKTARDAVKGYSSGNANSVFQSVFTPYSADPNAEVASFDFSQSKYNPNLSVDAPGFYTWMHNKFKGVDDAEVEKQQKKMDGMKDDAAKKVDEAQNKDRTGNTTQTNLYGNRKTYVPAEFPSGLDAQARFGLGGSAISSIGSIISAVVQGEYEGIRDALYSTEYVMDMFSYNTYDNEGKYNLYKGTKGTPPVSTAQYAAVSTAWKSTALTAKYNKTLTNKMINAENNVLFGSEVEYILYGKSNSSNVRSAYTDIFKIRYPLNLLSGFQNFWAGTHPTAVIINSAAMAISAATMGIVPVPVIKCIAILLLTAVETALDLDRLGDGFPVELYKKADDWRFSVDMDLIPHAKMGINNDKGLFYSDYIYVFTLMGFQSKSASEMYLRTADIIQVNMRRNTGASNYTLKNAKAYFKLEATIRVKPLMLALPMSSEGFSNNPKDKSDWCTFTISEIRGYS